MADWIELDTPVVPADLGLKPGMLIRFEDGDEVLVGDVNTNCGLCDCCYFGGYDDKVVAYRVVWEK